MTEAARKSELWMRPVSFAALQRILHVAAEHTDGIRAGDLDVEIRARALLATKKGSAPARTTLYHHRNTLVQLGALKRRARLLLVNFDDHHVRRLLSNTSPNDLQLNAESRDAFSELVLGNKNCKELFFDLFAPTGRTSPGGAHSFRAHGRPVVWRRAHEEDGSTEVVLRAERGDRSITLNSPSQVKGILYGLRYWARDELHLVDEFFREGRGSVLYPVLTPETRPSAHELVDEILALTDRQKEWTMLSVRELIIQLCEKRRRTLASLFEALRVLEKEYHRYVAFVPTSRSFATLTARSLAREEFELRGYFRDASGQYVSHLRIHNSIREQNHASAS